MFILSMMLRIFSKKADIEIHESSEFESIISHLKDFGYNPLMRNMISSSYQTANLQPPSQDTLSNIMSISSKKIREFTSENSGGEILFKDNSLFVVFPSYETTMISFIGFENELSSMEQFCNDFQKSIERTFDGRQMKGIKFNWSDTHDSPYGPYGYIGDGEFGDFNYRNNIPKDQKFVKPEYSDEEYVASKLLCDIALRTFLIKISKFGKIFEDDTKSELSESQIQTLFDHDLLTKEFLIRCTNDNRTICTIPSLETFQSDTSSDVKCAYCKRFLSKEKTTEIFTISDKGRKLMAGNKWMYVWITREFVNHGIKPESIDWQIEENGEEIDIRISDFKSTILLELKDREFGGGDVHPFIYRVNEYRGNIGGILTTEKIAKEAKNILNEQESKMSCKFVSCEGINAIEKGIERMVVDMSLIHINRHLKMFSHLYSPITLMIDSWVNRKISSHPPLEIPLTTDKSQSKLDQLKNRFTLEN